MSGRLVSIVFDSALPAWLKPYAAACASFAADDGTRVRPSVARIARMVGRSERSTQRALHDLCARGVLTLELKPGHHRPTRYVFRAVALPRVDDPAQLPLFPQATGHEIRRKGNEDADFSTGVNRFQQAWVTPVSVMGDTHVTRSVSDPSVRTHHQIARAREKANARKTGT